jgi:UDP:flavonoid glycosyltransferase YjiC (YdhE family)
VRILFTFPGGITHFIPMIPVAAAARSAGHEVAVSGQGALSGPVEAAGFPAFPSGPDDEVETTGALFDRSAPPAGRGIAARFARRYAPLRAADLVPLCQDWKPDLLVCGEVDFGAMVTAEHLGLPHAEVLTFAAGVMLRPAELVEPLDELRATYRLPPDPTAAMLDRHLRLSPFPPALRDPQAPVPDARLHFRHDIRPAGPRPAWATAVPNAPAAYFTLGTVFNTESGDLFARVLAALAELPVNTLVTVGDEVAIEDLGPRPANVTVEHFVPQAEVLPHCDLMISHAGSGSVLGATAHGLPSLLLPIGADQPHNAARCAALGLARVLDAGAAGVPEIRAAVTDLLTSPGYRAAARRRQAEFAALPTADAAVPLLEQLVDAR